MKIAGIVAEYNPFHTGHAYHVETTCEKCGANHIICVMSGNFTQRGEPAIWDKWTRAREALLHGVSLVLELPFIFATQSAEGFAQGAVSLLNALDCVDVLSFGTEEAAFPSLLDASHILAEEPSAFKALLKKALMSGASFPVARAKAVSALLPEAEPSIWEKPNNILALEYLKALSRIKSRIVPLPIDRLGSGYSDISLGPLYSSARAIREALKTGSSACRQYLFRDIDAFPPAVFPEALFPFLLFQLRRMTTDDIGRVYGVSEGLEYRIFKEAKNAESYEALDRSVSSKRYPHSRIRRILLYCLFGVTAERMADYEHHPLYARVLGVRRDALGLLSYLAKKSSVPIITKAASFPNNPLFEMDIQATEVYSLLTKKIAPGKRDFTQKLLIV